MKKIIGMIFGICLLAGCSKNEVPLYSDLDKVYFYERHYYLGAQQRTEELTWSFATKSSALMEGILEIKVRLQGRVDELRDRVVRAEVVADSTTAVEGTHFRLGDGVIKAGAYEGVLPVTFYRTPDMANEIFRIKLRMADSDDLKAGLEEDTYIRVLVSDILLKPANWPEWYGFGEYSANKYRFVLDELGIEDFPLLSRYDTEYVEGKFTPAQLYAYAYELQEAYQEYRKEYGPIYMDDDADPKVEISFND